MLAPADPPAVKANKRVILWPEKRFPPIWTKTKTLDMLYLPWPVFPGLSLLSARQPARLRPSSLCCVSWPDPRLLVGLARCRPSSSLCAACSSASSCRPLRWTDRSGRPRLTPPVASHWAARKSATNDQSIDESISVTRHKKPTKRYSRNFQLVEILTSCKTCAYASLP